MIIDDFSIQMESLSECDVSKHLESTKDDFCSRSMVFIQSYSKKLSHYAFFVTTRTDDNRIVGVIAFYANTLPEAFISHVWVSPEERGMGICGKMIQYINDFCFSKGFSYISLDVRCDNLSAIKSYEKNGFNIVASNDNKHRMTRKLL